MRRDTCSKTRPRRSLQTPIRRVHAGGRAIDPELATEAWTEADPLTDRERQVLRLAGDGRSSSDIANELQLSEGTVRNYLSEAISKVGGRNRVDARALPEQGLVVRAYRVGRDSLDIGLISDLLAHG